MNHTITIPEDVAFDDDLRPSIIKCYLRLHAVYEPSIWITASRSEIRDAIQINPAPGVYNFLLILATKDYLRMRSRSTPCKGGYPIVEFMLPPYPTPPPPPPQ